jgi:hypothetical protein
MATRYHRVNQDGSSLGAYLNGDTRCAVLAAANYAGSFVKLTAGKFAAAGLVDPGTTQLWILDEHSLTGQAIDAQITSGETATGHYVTEGRLFAVRCAAGAYVEGVRVYLTAAGLGTVTAGTDAVAVGYAKETVTLAGVDYVLVQVK